MAAIDMPANPQVNDTYKAPSNDTTYVCVSATPPVWVATGGGGGGGGGGGASVEVGINPPLTKDVGDLWYNTNDGILYVWYVDQSQVEANGEGQWVDTRPGNQG